MKAWVRRQYQKVALVAVRKVRSMVLLWARQCRKSTTLGEIAFDEMSRERGRNVIAASASLLTGGELISKTLSAAEQAQIVTRQAAAVQAAMTQCASTAEGLQLKCANSDTGKVYPNLSAEDFTDLYRSSRLEMRLYHDRTSYSRLLVIAPNPATARGWTGTVVRDEAGFTHAALERDLQIAVKPIMDTDPSFKLVYASNLPRDDRHPFFEMTLPDPGAEFKPNKDGHFYRGQNGILIHRVALADAYAAGHVLYDTREGKPMTYEDFCQDPANRLGLNESYRLIHEFGGAAAIDLLALTTSQRRGIGQCGFFQVQSDGDFEQAMTWLHEHLGNGEVGIGIDVATTTGDTSNPTSVTVTERKGIERTQVLVTVWKERKPQVARERFRRIIEMVRHRPDGGRARRVCIDSTSEKYFAEETGDELGHLVGFELVVASKSIEPAGYTEPTNYKTYLGDLYSASVNNNRYEMPADQYFKEDHRLVIKDRGLYVCEAQPDGRHGDTFDSGKLAEWALQSSNGALSSVEGIRMGGQQGFRQGRGVFRPRRLVRA
jgi:hypothetical protein